MSDYLTGTALDDAEEWARTAGLPGGDPETLAWVIEAAYPGGLHTFICQHLTPPPDETL